MLFSFVSYKASESQKKNTPASASKLPVKTSVAPCATGDKNKAVEKEDILKKLEEEKNNKKAFSLQGGNKGCTLK